MGLLSILSPARRALNPILADEPFIDLEASAIHVFYTPAAQQTSRHMELIVAAGAGAALVSSWLIATTGGPASLQNLLTFLAFVIGCLPAVGSAWEKLSERQIDVDLLMLLGAMLAAVIGSPMEGALLLFLFALSGGLESYALGRTHRALDRLRDLAPKEAIVLEDGVAQRTPIRSVTVGMTVLVRPGDRVPLDGTVLAGTSALNEAAITGESSPRDVAPGDTVYAGTLNDHGRLEVRVTRLAADTTLGRIIALVANAKTQPAKAQRLIDRIGPAYSIGVIACSVGAGIVLGLLPSVDAREAVRRAIAVLIVGSPCALIVATPVAYLSAIAAAARQGILIKGGAYLEALARTRAVVFDKTGTLTTGQIRLAALEVDGRLNRTEALRAVGAIEEASSHPLAGAVQQAVRAEGITPPTAESLRNLPGEGVSAVVEGKPVWVGRPEAVESGNAEGDFSARVRGQRDLGRTVSAFRIGDVPGVLAFEDTLRPGAAVCVRELRAQRVERVEMFTGDHELVARRIAGEVGLDSFRAAMKPEDKLNALEALRSEVGPVALVGDGVNDAPALARADVGIAIGSIGADVAMDAAHVVLINERIEGVSWLHRHAQHTARIVRQNLAFAIGVIVVLAVFSVAGRVPLPFAVVGHEGSTVLVALNALRLLRSRS